MSVELESARRLTALKNKIDTATSTTSSTLSEAVDNVIAGFGQGGGGSVETCTVTFTCDHSKPVSEKLYPFVAYSSGETAYEEIDMNNYKSQTYQIECKKNSFIFLYGVTNIIMYQFGLDPQYAETIDDFDGGSLIAIYGDTTITICEGL